MRRRWTTGGCSSRAWWCSGCLRGRYLTVKEKKRVECLVLCGGGHSALGQVSEECFHLPFGGLLSKGLLKLQESSIAAEPMGVGFFGVEGEVPEHTSLSDQGDCV